MRASRSSACLSVSTSGSALPVMADCCMATRMAASRSASTFSSRERASAWISSSICVRCIEVSATRASSSASLAAVSRAVSSAWRARVRASVAWLPLSCWRLTSSASSPSTCFWALQASTAAAVANAASTAAPAAIQRPGKPGVAGTGATEGAGTDAAPGSADSALTGASFTGAPIVGAATRHPLASPSCKSRTCCATARGCGATRPTQPQPARRAASAMRGCEARAAAADQSASGASVRKWPTASLLEKSHRYWPGAASAASSRACEAASSVGGRRR